MYYQTASPQADNRRLHDQGEHDASSSHSTRYRWRSRPPACSTTGSCSTSRPSTRTTPTRPYSRSTTTDVAFVALDKTAYNQSQFEPAGRLPLLRPRNAGIQRQHHHRVRGAECHIPLALQELRRLPGALGLEPDRRVHERQLRPGVEPRRARARSRSSRPTGTRATSTTRSTTASPTTSTARSASVASSPVPQRLYIGRPDQRDELLGVGLRESDPGGTGLHIERRHGLGAGRQHLPLPDADTRATRSRY